MSPKIFITGSGRCGTKSMSLFLNESIFSSGGTVDCLHETDRENFLEILNKKDRQDVDVFFESLSNSIEVSPYISLLPKKPKNCDVLVSIVRDGRDTVRSGMNTGWFLDMSSPYSWEKYLPSFKGNRFEKCCQLWNYVYEKLENWGASFFLLEKLASSSDHHRKELFTLLKIVPHNRTFPSSNFALKAKKYIKDSGIQETPHWKEWSQSQNDVFNKHCGKLMRKYYP